MNAEMIARLAPKTCQLDGVGGGGWGEMATLDIAAGLAGAPAGGQLAVLAAYAGQWDVVPELCGRIGGALMRLARAERWKGMTRQRIEVLATIAVREFCAPPLCGVCEGRAIEWVPEPRDCTECGGSGSGRVAGSLVCEELGVDEGEWRREWRYRYDRAYSICASWGSEALSHMARRLQ